MPDIAKTKFDPPFRCSTCNKGPRKGVASSFFFPKGSWLRLTAPDLIFCGWDCLADHAARLLRPEGA